MRRILLALLYIAVCVSTSSLSGSPELSKVEDVQVEETYSGETIQKVTEDVTSLLTSKNMIQRSGEAGDDNVESDDVSGGSSVDGSSSKEGFRSSLVKVFKNHNNRKRGGSSSTTSAIGEQVPQTTAFFASFLGGWFGLDWFVLSQGNGWYITAGVAKLLSLGNILSCLITNPLILLLVGM